MTVVRLLANLRRWRAGNSEGIELGTTPINNKAIHPMDTICDFRHYDVFNLIRE